MKTKLITVLIFLATIVSLFIIIKVYPSKQTNAQLQKTKKEVDVIDLADTVYNGSAIMLVRFISQDTAIYDTFWRVRRKESWWFTEEDTILHDCWVKIERDNPPYDDLVVHADLQFASAIVKRN